MLMLTLCIKANK